MKNNTFNLSITITIAATAALIAAMWFVTANRTSDTQVMLLPNKVMTLFPDPKPLAPFTLTDHLNQAFDLSRLKRKWSFIFFGYTHCPDICPITLAELARTYSLINSNAAGVEDVQFVFVSVDPHRDTIDILREYVGFFNKAFLGVTGDDSQIANLAGQLKAAYEVSRHSDDTHYPVTHTSAVFLVDPRGRYHAVITPPLDAKTISARFNLVRLFDLDDKT